MLLVNIFCRHNNKDLSDSGYYLNQLPVYKCTFEDHKQASIQITYFIFIILSFTEGINVKLCKKGFHFTLCDA